MIDAKEIEFDPSETPNVITAPMPKHGQGVNVVEKDVFVTSVEELVTPLMTIKESLLKAGLFPGCGEGCHFCSILPTGCPLLKAGVQRLMDDKEILFEKTLVPTISCEYVAIITIFANPRRAFVKRPVRITSIP